MIDLMDGFYIYPNEKPLLSGLRHKCTGTEWGYAVFIDSDECGNCQTTVPKKVVVMYKLWEFNR